MYLRYKVSLKYSVATYNCYVKRQVFHSYVQKTSANRGLCRKILTPIYLTEMVQFYQSKNNIFISSQVNLVKHGWGVSACLS